MDFLSHKYFICVEIYKDDIQGIKKHYDLKHILFKNGAELVVCLSVAVPILKCENKSKKMLLKIFYFLKYRPSKNISVIIIICIYLKKKTKKFHFFFIKFYRPALY